MEERSPSEPLTALLARRARSGDLERFDQLCQRLMPSLTSWAALRIPTVIQGALEPAEIVQETWARALAAFDSFDETRSSFRAWLFGIAKNVLLEALRSRRHGVAVQQGSNFLHEVPDQVTSISRRLMRDESLACFREFVASLEREERELVVICGLEGLSAREAALRLQISEEAAKKRWQRLRAELARRTFPRECFEDT